MRVVGLTGGIGTGKSTVGRMVHQARGVPVIDADQVAREVVAPGSPVLDAIAKAFGPGVLQRDGTLDRSALRERIARDAGARATLNGLTHPAILGRIAQQLSDLAAKGTPAAIVEAALMVETGSYKAYDDLIVVSCSPDAQLARVVARDGQTEASARALIATQLPLAEKEAVATVVIRNDADLEALRERSLEAWDGLMGRSG